MSGRKYLTGMVFLSILFLGTVLFAGEWCYYIQDHLGNTRVVLDNTGKVKEYYDYEPYGKSLRENIAGEDKAIYKFTGKELDEEGSLNWYYFGARYYDAELGRFLVPDRFADKYPSLSPYSYTAGNPLRYIDINGDRIWVTDGSERFLYTGNSYKGKNKTIASIVNNLQKINANKAGAKVLSALIKSELNYTVEVVSDLKQGRAGEFRHFGKGGGTVALGANGLNVGAIAEEIFHGYQYEKGVGGSNIKNEVEAKLFSSAISGNRAFGRGGAPYFGVAGAYQSSMEALLKNWNPADFYEAVRTFQRGSRDNETGVYTNFPLGEELDILIDELYPLIGR